MISFLGRQFCSQSCANSRCSRNLNDAVMRRAREWWGKDNPPIMMGDMKTDECGFSPLINKE